MGNSEVGHMNIGAGRIVDMGLRKIERSIENKEFSSLPGIMRFSNTIKAAKGNAHLCGVLSDGGVNSHIDNMIETAKILENLGLKIILHLFGDGRDVAPKSIQTYLGYLNSSIVINTTICSLTGRYY